MEVVAAVPPPNGNIGPPFHNHDVREWSRIDSLTGVLERARFETDHWTANTSNSSHAYGKVVDSRTRSNADGALQQRARRQLEVFESSVPGGRLQVIKSHTVSSSRWTSGRTVANVTGSSGDRQLESAEERNFGDLNLSLNPLDLTSQKSRATVGRSVGRRPPSRPRLRDEAPTHSSSSAASSSSCVASSQKSGVTIQELPNSTSNHDSPTSSPRVHRISRLCNQIHENAVRQTFGAKYAAVVPKPPDERRNETAINETKIKTNLNRTKSTSSEDVLCPEENLDTWRRSSKIRRSLQFHSPSKASSPSSGRVFSSSKPDDLPANTGNVRKIREDLETGRRLNTALRGNSIVDLETLDNILQSLSSSDQNSISSDQAEKDDNLISFKKQKRNSFVTVESLKEVKDRLRRTSSPDREDLMGKKEEEIDDGIVTEETVRQFSVGGSGSMSESSSSRVRSYVYGMEKISGTGSGRKPIVGTGSLENRPSKQSNGNMNYRDEDWYNRRKSYGFEQVHNHQQEPINARSKIIESSTDSGICRSGEILQDPCAKTATPFQKSSFGKISDFYCDNESIKKDLKQQNVVKRYTSMFEKRSEDTSVVSNGGSGSNGFDGTITIPVINQNGSFQTNGDDCNALNHKPWENGFEVKRHSIAVDESKYVSKSTVNTNYRRTSLAVNSSEPLDDENFFQRKPKRVEFCKTEVHFAADSGRVNIVATDDKPPPTNNFRRRRRNSGTLYDQLLIEANKNGLPVLHFGDSLLEKDTFLGAENHTQEENGTDSIEALNTGGIVTVSTNNSSFNGYYDTDEVPQKDTAEEAPKGILKNKPIKPKPYLLGDDNFFSKPLVDDAEDSKDNNDNSKIWGVKLKPVNSYIHQNKPSQETAAPMWKSTVTLKNTLFEKQKNKNCSANIVEPHSESFYGSKNSAVKSEKDEEIQSVSSSSAVIEESKGFSTKVNIGGGEATVISDDLERVKGRPAWPGYNEPIKDFSNLRINEENCKQSDYGSTTPKHWTKPSPNNGNNRVPRSPVVLRRSSQSASTRTEELRMAKNSAKLSSPFLVVQNAERVEREEKSASVRCLTSSTGENVPHYALPTITKSNLEVGRSSQASPLPSRQILRTPKKSEMAYFGVQASPSPKPFRKVVALPKTQHASTPPRRQKESSPIYENVAEMRRASKPPAKEFDISVLEELTKAADQILEAVNELTAENSSSSKAERRSVDKLETISEAKSWNHKIKHQSSDVSEAVVGSLKAGRKTSVSTSSVESVANNRESRKVYPQKSTSGGEQQPERYRKKSNGDATSSSSSRAATKARRLQRASSREALLQSHGSSSEDLPVSVEVPVRKPRLVRKTKTSSQGSESVRQRSLHYSNDRRALDEKRKSEEKVGALPEIRHKTAVSTIRSTAEKSFNRDRLQNLKTEEAKKKYKKDVPKAASTPIKSEKVRSVQGKDSINHRIATASIKKCSRYERSARL